MTTPIVSVVMSVFNGDSFLREAVESILNQSFREFEFTIIDDGSTDSSSAILDSYQRNDPRVRVYHQENRGLVESLNRGCGLARGKYIARMDADDISFKNRLLWQVEFMERHPEVGVLGGATEIINATGKLLTPDTNVVDDYEIKSGLLRGECPLVHPTVLMRTDVYLSVGGYRKVAVDAEDFDLWLRFAEHCKLANLDAPVLKYRRHQCQVSVRKFRQQALSNLGARAAALLRRSGKSDPLDSVEEITPKVLSELGVTESMQQASVARAYLTSIRSMCDATEYEVASDLLLEMLHSLDWKHVKLHIVAEYRFLTARLYWCQGKFLRSILNAGHALITRPIILARPLKPLLRWFRRQLAD
ncbi:glycosyltransferase [Methylomicrobium sp. Wu6]|uniref:glycosyltransferase n=1 Tax=Methylomicrobium sp. Wu6 TaxID=3107928 RepID=UPI002DD62CB0|nr:glycosyltransferase [Methylomicrobium sp. Wu6]MEC4749589.1 glycosyltransferase [Methylomicrobium sp. Wu6]